MRSKNAIYNIITNIFLQLIIIVYGFIVPKIIISYYGSSVNGLVSSITQFLGYIALLESGFGPVLKSALYKPIAEKKHYEIEKILASSNSFFKKIAKIFILYIIILTIIYPILINKEFSFLFSSSLILIISISTFAEYYFGMTYRIYLQAEQKNYIISIIQIISYLINILLLFLMIKLNASIHTIKLVTSFVFIFRPIFQNIYVKNKFKINITKKTEKAVIKQKWDGLAQHIAFVVHSNTDVTLLTIFSSLIDVSIYSVYKLIVNGVRSLAQIFTIGIDSSFGDIIARNEEENLNKQFQVFEIFCHLLNTILFACSFILIVPFVSIYTANVTDANYIQYTFGHLLVISEYIWAIRLPYNTLVSASGKFKETRKGAWVECIINIIISLILIKPFGLVGVVIGTIIAMTVRTCELIYFANKNILKRNLDKSIKNILVSILLYALIIICGKNLFNLNISSVYDFILSGLKICCLSLLFLIIFSFIFYRSEIMFLINKFNNIKKGEIKMEKMKKKKKNILLTTLFGVSNYGTVLQAYATQLELKKLGYNCELLNYTQKRLSTFNVIKKSNRNISGIKSKLYVIASILFRAIPNIILKNNFSRFIKKNLNLTKDVMHEYNEVELNNHLNNYDCYITGSDQVWNSEYNGGIDYTYYLGFVPNNKNKISYASSIGMEDFRKSETAKIKELLSRYNKISVREISAQKALNNLKIKSDLVLDPTMLISNEEWKTIESNIKIKRKYLLVYILGRDKSIINIAKKIAKEKNLKIVKIGLDFIYSKNIYKNYQFASPNDFIYLFRHADFILTNSFHGIAFSVNFNKQFLAVSPKTYNTRLVSILSLFDLSNNLIKDENYGEIEKIDYEVINKKLELYRNHSRQFLEKSINSGD